MFALIVDDVMGWLPNYLRLFVLVFGLAGGLAVVQQRALEPLGRGWTVASVFIGGLAMLTAIPGAWLCVRAEDLPALFAGPFVLLGLLGLWLINTALTPVEPEA